MKFLPRILLVVLSGFLFFTTCKEIPKPKDAAEIQRQKLIQYIGLFFTPNDAEKKQEPSAGIYRATAQSLQTALTKDYQRKHKTSGTIPDEVMEKIKKTEVFLRLRRGQAILVTATSAGAGPPQTAYLYKARQKKDHRVMTGEIVGKDGKSELLLKWYPKKDGLLTYQDDFGRMEFKPEKRSPEELKAAYLPDSPANQKPVEF